MGIEIKVNSIDEMCDLMCNNKLPSRKKKRECIHCKKFFECEGRPAHIDRCLQFEERKDG